MRLAKRLAEQIPCSRQEAEQYIAGAWVRVDGEIVEEPGFRVRPEQQVELSSEASLLPLAPVTIMMHKAAGVETQTLLQGVRLETLTQSDRSGLRFLKRHATGLTLCSGLETKAAGLVVLTQDWQISRKLVEDAAKVEHEYVVEVTGSIAPYGLALLNHGLTFNGKALAPMKVSWQNENRLRFALKGGQPYQITHMCEQVGLAVVGLKRIRVGRVPMAGLPVGEWRYLLGYERF
jgi:23S rRNA pseudouridine2604 synthase